MREISDDLGHSSYIFHNPLEMLEALKNHTLKPDIIFLDITMPKIDGYKVLEELRKLSEYDNIPIVI